MEHYKSWSGIKGRLEESLCDPLKNRITYFLTRYHKVHDAYGRAAIRLEGKELVCFSWIEMYRQEYAVSQITRNNLASSYKEAEDTLKSDWDKNCTYYDMDFLEAVQKFFHLSIQDALESDNYIIKVLAVLDRRVGKRTLKQICMKMEYLNYPDWVKQFYQLRFDFERITLWDLRLSL
ncbi:SF0329 family protein [Clostridium beijerinckii]|uniref:Uncharacterized protein n=3 Tax=Clostridium beijerinckii TaxID=1520 RepID=A0AAE2RVA7_CLOBE|nr:hypothetical protein [Clostridium beijerinckii]ABR34777.1 conserved hypothetical protein [Clostridium beijerinckii NCIMB 8052]AIU01246.1 hypothetical protein Cbs_2623 [Clostridium beijerinckii ATCC 35702]MBF7810592.1 hypothetical protein [Clostridium beijerinckii]NOW91311.1 hypothetical protein [Clostridium beijerinckii]NRT23869.1 hypothetical protein [Clostridium beijerinckii]